MMMLRRGHRAWVSLAVAVAAALATIVRGGLLEGVPFLGQRRDAAFLEELRAHPAGTEASLLSQCG